MREFVNKQITTLLAALTGAVIVGLNTYLVYYIMASYGVYLQILILAAYGGYHFYLVCAMMRAKGLQDLNAHTILLPLPS